VILLVMQTVDNAMRMVWKNTLFGGKMKIDNSGQKKVPAYIPIGQEVMRRYSDILTSISLMVQLYRETQALIPVLLLLRLQNMP
jgi:cholesterol oxidase